MNYFNFIDKCFPVIEMILPKRKVTIVVVHCAATPDSNVPAFDINDIILWHIQRGFRTVGYQRVIKRNGTIQRGRSDEEMGAHAKGYNRASIGICYFGTERPTKAQKNSFRKLFLEYKEKYGLGIEAWRCHNEFSTKDCPGFNQDALHDILRGAA